MAAVIFQLLTSFYAIFSKINLFSSPNNSATFLGCEDNSIAHNDDKLCRLRSCRYHVLLIGDFEDRRKNWMQSASATKTWTICIRLSSTDSVKKMLPTLDWCLTTCREWFVFIKEPRQGTECPASQKRSHSGESTEN